MVGADFTSVLVPVCSAQTDSPICHEAAALQHCCHAHGPVAAPPLYVRWKPPPQAPWLRSRPQMIMHRGEETDAVLDSTTHQDGHGHLSMFQRPDYTLSVAVVTAHFHLPSARSKKASVGYGMFVGALSGTVLVLVLSSLQSRRGRLRRKAPNKA